MCVWFWVCNLLIYFSAHVFGNHYYPGRNAQWRICTDISQPGNGSAAETVSWWGTSYFEAIDLAMSSIRDLFDQPGYATYRKLEDLLLNACQVREYREQLQYLCDLYQELDVQLHAEFEGSVCPVGWMLHQGLRRIPTRIIASSKNLLLWGRHSSRWSTSF